MSEKDRVKFEAGDNIAMKIPPHQYDATVRFYRDILRLPQVENDEDSLVFEFGDKKLWLDKVNTIRIKDKKLRRRLTNRDEYEKSVSRSVSLYRELSRQQAMDV